MTIYERLLKACCPDSTVNIEEHAQLVLRVVCEAKQKGKR
jgi:hypothetical protein